MTASRALHDRRQPRQGDYLQMRVLDGLPGTLAAVDVGGDVVTPLCAYSQRTLSCIVASRLVHWSTSILAKESSCFGLGRDL